MIKRFPLHDAHVFASLSRKQHIEGQHVRALRCNVNYDRAQIVESMRVVARLPSDDEIKELTGCTFAMLTNELVETVDLVRQLTGDEKAPTIERPPELKEQTGNARTHQTIDVLKRYIRSIPFRVGVTDELLRAYGLSPKLVMPPVAQDAAPDTKDIPSLISPDHVIVKREQLALNAIDDPVWVSVDDENSLRNVLTRLRNKVNSRYVDPHEFEPLTLIDENDTRGQRLALQNALRCCVRLQKTFASSTAKDVRALERLKELVEQAIVSVSRDAATVKGRVHEDLERQRLAIGFAVLHSLLTGSMTTSKKPKSNPFLQGLTVMLEYSQSKTTSDDTIVKLASVAASTLVLTDMSGVKPGRDWMRGYTDLRQKALARHAYIWCAQRPKGDKPKV